MKRIAMLSSTVMLLAVLLAIGGCGGKQDVTDGAAASDHSRSRVESGPVCITAEVQPAQLRLSDTPTLTLTIDSEEGVAVEKPDFGDTIGRFAIRDTREPLQQTNNGRIIARQVLTLEPLEAGRLRIEPIAVSFTDNREQGDHSEHTIETEPLVVEVTSLVGDKTPNLADLRPAAAPMALPSAMPAWGWALLTLVVASVAIIVWRKYRCRAKIEAMPVLTPEQLADAELDKLVASGLAERDIKLFYVELTAIVRRYIERTTGIRAPEQTTEEFLRETARTRTFEQEMRLRLREFLESADLVKFAAHQPKAEDIDESIRRARLFIGAKKTQP